jgi:ParB/RepB/Spo0J family partition protein
MANRAASVPLDSISWSEPSRAIDAGHVKELAASITEVGLINPISVVDLGGGKYEGRAGRHRYEALKSLGEKVVDVMVLDLENVVDHKLATIHENLKRLDLDPIQKARQFQEFLDARKKQEPTVTQEAVAKELQVSPSELSNTLLLLRQEAHIQKLVQDGHLTPGHIEHVIAPLGEKLVKVATEILGAPPGKKEVEAAVVKFAHDIAGDPARKKAGLDIRTAEREAEDILRRYEGELLRHKLGEYVRKAKAKTCPTCDDEATGFSVVQGRVVFHDNRAGNYEGGERHRWDAETGELHLSPAQRKAVAEVEAARSKAAKIAAKVRKKEKHEVRKVVREYAVVMCRAPISKWSEGLRSGAEPGITSIVAEPGRLAVEGAKTKLALPVVKAGGAGPDLRLYLSPVDIPDGHGGYHTRVQIGAFSSSGSAQDNILDSSDEESARFKELHAARAELLAFQAKVLGVKQTETDLGPEELGGFRVGERVRIGSRADTASYRGKSAAILAFDMKTNVRTRYGNPAWDSPYGERGAIVQTGDQPYAALNLNASTKLWPLSTLEKLTKWACAKCGTKAVVRVIEGKEVRICDECGLGEAKCSCPPKKKAARGARKERQAKLVTDSELKKEGMGTPEGRSKA